MQVFFSKENMKKTKSSGSWKNCLPGAGRKIWQEYDLFAVAFVFILGCEMVRAQ